MRWTIIADWIPRPRNFGRTLPLPKPATGRTSNSIPVVAATPFDASEVRAQRAALCAPPHRLLDDAAEPWTAFAEAGEGDLRVLAGIVRGHALNRQAGDGSRTRQRA
jgi:hypothetical protein